MAIPIGGGECLDARTPRPLFPISNPWMASLLWDSAPLGSDICGVTPDNQKFLFLSLKSERVSSINVVLNWRSMLRDAQK